MHFSGESSGEREVGGGGLAVDLITQVKLPAKQLRALLPGRSDDRRGAREELLDLPRGLTRTVR